MLPRRHRVTVASDFRAVTRAGGRAGGSCVVISARLADRPNHPGDPAPGVGPDATAWRCGFIVSKAVGNSVVRHRTQRRLRHIIWDIMREGSVEVPEGARLDVVVRALPAAVEAAHDELISEVRSTLLRAVRKARRRREGEPDAG
ncbi:MULTISPECIES: ribonuclease P protein component [Actinomycetes]|uniref:ribonuclease P protein component n=1 Tax=Actinomycetes TaxID=1760 RepID=UPI0031DAF4BC